MSAIHVCPLSRLDETLQESGASHVITLLTHLVPEALGALPPERLLRLEISDIVEARDGYSLPAQDHIARLVDFVRDWDRRRPLLIHCYAGVSRSTAAAYIALCVLEPGSSETELAARLRAASPTATPNAKLIGLADAFLGRSGRMITAIDAIGRGAECFEGLCFALPVGGRTEKTKPMESK